MEHESPNVMHTFKRFKENIYIEKIWQFFQSNDLTWDDFYSLGIPVMDN